MIRRPPRSTLFPSRRSSDLEMLLGIDALVFDIQDAGVRFYTYITTMGYAMEESAKRSEEHTSELQSRLHLVCRLLLEKKNPHSHICEYIYEPTQYSYTLNQY